MLGFKDYYSQIAKYCFVFIEISDLSDNNGQA